MTELPRSGDAGAGDFAAGDTGAGGAGVTAGAGGTGAARIGGAGGAKAGDPTEPGAARVGGAGAVGAGAGGTGAGGAGAGGARTIDPGAGGAGGDVRPRPYFIPLLQQVLGVPSSTDLTPPLMCPPPDHSQPPLQPASPVPAPSPYTEQTVSLTERLTLVKSELQKRHTCTDLGELRNYLGLQITRDRARRTITLTQSHMVHRVLQRFGFRFSSPQPTPLSTGHSLSAPPSDESVEPSGPYPELVGCLMYLMTCTRPDLAYPLSLLACYVAPGRHQKVHWDAAKRVLCYLCSTSSMGLVLGGRGPVVLTGHADASWELRWLTYLLTNLGGQPRSPPVLYVDNKAIIALCQEHSLEHRTKHIALRYFLARELQQRGQLCLAYVATRANTADVFTKALPPGDHQRFVTVLGLVPTLPHLLTA
ncbi:unnamed protein product [Closterium sp. NIES-54]